MLYIIYLRAYKKQANNTALSTSLMWSPPVVEGVRLAANLACINFGDVDVTDDGVVVPFNASVQSTNAP
jgi:hypothetical protein